MEDAGIILQLDSPTRSHCTSTLSNHLFIRPHSLSTRTSRVRCSLVSTFHSFKKQARSTLSTCILVLHSPYPSVIAYLYLSKAIRLLPLPTDLLSAPSCPSNQSHSLNTIPLNPSCRPSPNFQRPFSKSRLSNQHPSRYPRLSSHWRRR
jgi:hypothetical protein